MRLSVDLWGQYSTYLFVDRKLKRNHTYLSRFKILCDYFSDKEFTRTNFTMFLSSLQEQGKQPAYINKFISTVKHIAKFLAVTGFEDYTYFDDESTKEKVHLTNDQVKQLAYLEIPYAIRRSEINYRMRCLINTLGIGGFRITETLLLKKTDVVSYPTWSIHIRKETNKTRKERFCPIPQWLYNDLQALPDKETLFSIKYRQKALEDIKRRATILFGDGMGKLINNHTFRHASINNKAREGVPIEQNAKYHGHIKIETTYKYYLFTAIQEMADTLAMYDPNFQLEQADEVLYERIRRTLAKLLPTTRFNQVALNEVMLVLIQVLQKHKL